MDVVQDKLRKKTEETSQLLEKAHALTALLTLDEKIGMIHGMQLFQTEGVPRLGIPPLKMSDGPMGVRQEFAPDKWKAVGGTDDYVTYLPCNSALAATWNRNLAYEVGSVLGEEARGRGKDVILAPGINLKRSPLCGRNFEYFSEDPYLTKELAVPFIQGIQNWDVAACVKHFAVNNQETERLWVDVKVDEETLRSLYLPAFYDALVKAGSYTVMGAYNQLYGEHCCQSKYLLDDILRREWGYDGVVISDWGGVHDTKAAANSSLDIEMSVTYDFEEYYLANPLKKAVLAGEICESVIDEKVTRILLLMLRLHMLDGTRKAGTYNTEEHRQTALKAARESIILLKNKQNLLPLSIKNGGKILIIGENANTLHANGGGSAEIKALYEISPLMGIKKLLGGNVNVDYLEGYCRDEEVKEQEINWQEASLEHGGGSTAKKEEEKKELLAEKREKLRQEAVEKALLYDQVIFVGGLNHNQDCEGNDRADMKLPYEQDVLLMQLLHKRPDTIVVMTAGSQVEMRNWIDQADTLVWSWYGGMEGGTALAEVLFGKVNPSGKLPESFYQTHTDCSAHCLGEFGKNDQVNYREGNLVGYRYLDTYQIEPQFCFGYGLSYTSFSYENGRILRKGKDGVVSCLISNTGDVEGGEVVQVYIRPVSFNKGNSLTVQELKGFEKVWLKPGEAQIVFIKLENLFGESKEETKEEMQIAVGSSSRDIRILLVLNGNKKKKQTKNGGHNESEYQYGDQ